MSDNRRNPYPRHREDRRVLWQEEDILETSPPRSRSHRLNTRVRRRSGHLTARRQLDAELRDLEAVDSPLNVGTRRHRSAESIPNPLPSLPSAVRPTSYQNLFLPTTSANTTSNLPGFLQSASNYLFPNPFVAQPVFGTQPTAAQQQQLQVQRQRQA